MKKNSCCNCPFCDFDYDDCLFYKKTIENWKYKPEFCKINETTEEVESFLSEEENEIQKRR